MPIKADHEIEVRVVGDDAVPSIDISKIEMHVGETVRYSSPDGEVKILFPFRSPFRSDDLTGTEIPGSVILTLRQPERSTVPPGLPDFLCRCFITNSAGVTVGWRKDPSKSGGDHHVKP
jgi:hypothetical protein